MNDLAERINAVMKANVYPEAYTDAQDSIDNRATLKKICELIDTRYAETTKQFTTAAAEGLDPDGEEYKKLKAIIEQSQESIAHAEKKAVQHIFTQLNSASKSSPPHEKGVSENGNMLKSLEKQEQERKNNIGVLVTQKMIDMNYLPSESKSPPHSVDPDNTTAGDVEQHHAHKHSK